VENWSKSITIDLAFLEMLIYDRVSISDTKRQCKIIENTQNDVSITSEGDAQH
jgi:hypothetical protein